MARKDDADQAPEPEAERSEERICGVVRPIAAFDDYPASHWIDVHQIIAEALKPIGFRPRLVSESDAVGIIVADIVRNLYSDEIVICDVSGRNPNVMFELGMRVTFEKSVIIIMDDRTPFSFDIMPIKHLRYPSSLRYTDILEFKSQLAQAVTATMEKGSGKVGYLQQFGPIEVTGLNEQQVDLSDLAATVQDVQRTLAVLVQGQKESRSDAYSLHGGALFPLTTRIARVGVSKDGLSLVKAIIERHGLKPSGPIQLRDGMAYIRLVADGTLGSVKIYQAVDEIVKAIPDARVTFQ